MPEATFRHPGQAIDYTPSGADVAAGQVIQVGGLVGVANVDIADGVLGALQVEGVFDVTKASGGGVTFAAGATVGWNNTTNTAVAAGTGNFDIGVAVEAAADADAFVRVKINW